MSSLATRARWTETPAPLRFNPAAKARIEIGHALVDRCTFSEAVSTITEFVLRRGSSAYVITPNAQHIVLLHKYPHLREIYRSADLVLPDGVSLLLAARVLGCSFPARVPGVDLFQGLCHAASQTQLRVFLLGGRPGSAEAAAAQMRSRFPKIQAETYCPPLGFENDPEELGRISNVVQCARPDLLFVAFGAPKQEFWMYEHGRKLGLGVCVGVGGTFEMVAGMVPRAPRWVQGIGCEWAYRLCKEPRRMWRRYLVGNLQFIWVILLQVMRAGTYNKRARQPGNSASVTL